jgi:C4-dicarboxylate transporter DctM subunit
MTFALFVVPIVLLLIGFPIFMVLLTAVTVALVFFMHVPLVVVHQNLFGSINATPLLAVPFFIYAGELMGRGSVAQRLVDFVQGGVGSVRGSLGVTAVGTSAIFGAISGASAATVATIGKVMVPAMSKAGYPETFTAGLITAVGAIDVVIPPSIPMIVYGAAAEESVARLYAAGVIPGLLIAFMIAGYVMWRAKRENFGVGQPFELKHFLHAAGRSVWALGAPVIILGGIYGGVFSPTEAASVACVYAALVTAFIFRELVGHSRSRGDDRDVHRANPDHRRLRRRFCVAADRQPGSSRSDRVAAIAQRLRLDVAARDQHSPAGGGMLS